MRCNRFIGPFCITIRARAVWGHANHLIGAEIRAGVRVRRGVIAYAGFSVAHMWARHGVYEAAGFQDALNGARRSIGGSVLESRGALPSAGSEGGWSSAAMMVLAVFSRALRKESR